ncbi:MAG: hydroxyacylglutathione hydrolase [Lysobacterales bacterium]|jgi:hydroxyacylglutathione hydrolase|nr:MAG: hydroxyacylglutathione hydrolase [Xanthomonadales bacterium]
MSSTRSSSNRRRLFPVPILADNYVWLWARGGHCLIVDPGEAAPVLARLDAEGLEAVAILLTHHHADHIAGAEDIRKATGAAVYGPRDPRIACVQHEVTGGDRIRLPALELDLEVLALPGHTRTHVGYFGSGVLFCGDTLFSLGCGRIFEGSAEALHASLERLAKLPGETLVCPAHEYTLANAAFALTIEPDNPGLRSRAAEAERLREAGLPTLPSTIARERQTNPFLRCREPAVKRAVGLADGDPVAVFAALRAAKDRFPSALRSPPRMP